MLKGFKIIKVFSFLQFGRKKLIRESSDWDSLYRTVAYSFKDETVLMNAMTHRSYLHDDMERWASNERLEFLGDAVLGMLVTETLFKKYPQGSEGELTKAKSFIVSRSMLAKRAQEINLGRFLYMGNGEDRSGGRQRKSILSDAFEALIGAIYIDGGLEAARRFVKKFVLQNVNQYFQSEYHQNFKSWLLEYAQARGDAVPKYKVLKETGPDHQKVFTIIVTINGKTMGKGKGFTKKSAEQNAAKHAIEKLGLNLKR
jgi:ribonuclease-3